MAAPDPTIVLVSGAGFMAGAVLLARGMLLWRRREAVADIATSQVSALAAGEARLTGTVQAVALTLVSPLQSRPCVYYRAHVTESRGREQATVFAEERAVGFTLDDGSGTIRVLPRAAAWEVAWTWQGSSGLLGDEPPELDLNHGSQVADLALDHEAQVRELLTVHDARGPDLLEGAGSGTWRGLGPGMGGRHYAEARLEPGATVTIVGSALPYRDVADPATAGLYDPAIALGDPEVAADLDAAMAAGTLEAGPAEAWGNAAIPGFGIGRPTRPPELDPQARPEAVVPDAPTAEAASAARFEIPAEALVLAATPEAPLTVYAGTPQAVTAEARNGLWLALAGVAVLVLGAAVLAVGLGAVP
jgi:hypothetical protein